MKKTDREYLIVAAEESAGRPRIPWIAAVIAAAHIVALGGFLALQGCRTRPPSVEPPPTPVMPPRADISTAPPVVPKPVFQPPVAETLPPAAVPEAERVHIVASGESLSRIAARYGVTIRELQDLNKIKDPNKIRIGQKLVLPPHADMTKAPAREPAQARETKAPRAFAGPDVYVVRPGDSLSVIAKRHGTTVRALKEVNNLQSDVIRAGQKLKLPAGAKPSAQKPAGEGAARPAASAGPVASKPAVPPAVERPTAEAPSVSRPAPAAPAAPARQTAAGTDATRAPAPSPAPAVAPAPAPAPAVAPTPPAPGAGQTIFEYTVRPNETLDDIARNFAVLRSEIMALNNMAEGDEVKVGQRIRIPMSSP